MAFCKNCGKALAPEDKFCSGCGEPVIEKTETYENAENINDTENTGSKEQGTYEAPYEPISESVFTAPVQTGKMSVGMLVWAIINTVISFCSCCLPIGIIPLIFAIKTNKADVEEAQKNRKRALVFNIIVTALILLITIVNIVVMIFYAEELEQLLIEYAGEYAYY